MLVTDVGGDVVTLGNLPPMLCTHLVVAAEPILSVAHRSPLHPEREW